MTSMASYYFDSSLYQPRVLLRNRFHDCPGSDSEYPNSRCTGSLKPRTDTMGYECPLCGRKATEEELYKRERERRNKNRSAVEDWRLTGDWNFTI